ncbi:unnamed protein product (macronuclear) [Paramecium tetraurelia]|uniref:Transmembrane protein n=1 Tax=Paramecium tetraurelia TaxID=5888 RepID=A0DQ79_PARTE|nr:uncharacterized protein GSPATT00002596001 [Paramecium tetraurelia]CAK85196.1 unnamed protein product [Paramecium tetraurelia]|eukprot:XP_001452593.1 hypothetical protein (macronuclear) [Paramecium tetraurelia strain d4-2]
MELLCLCCECCFPDHADGFKCGGIACFGCCYCCAEGYSNNISGNKSRVYRFINIVLISIFTAVAVVLTSIIQSQTSLSNQQITNIFDNWQLGALTDIQIFDFCPEDFELLSSYSIPGTQDGCICMDDRELSTTDCTDWQLLQGCYNIEIKDPIDLFKWAQPANNSFYAVEICGKRSALPFYDLLKNKITTAEDCKANGYKVCQTESTTNFYCVLQDEACPLREIIISSYQLSEYDIQQNNYSLIYDKGFYTYVGLSKETTPLMNFAIVKGKGVCFDNSKYSLNPKLEEDYILFDPAPEDCVLDDSYFQISTTTEKQLFQLNNILSLVQSERPLYNISSKIQYQLLAQNQIYFKQDCRSNNFEQLIDLDSRFKSQSTLIICQLVFSCVSFVVILIFMTNELHRCFYKDCGKCYAGFQFLIKELIVYLLGITVIVGYSFMIDLVITLDDFTKKNCFPQSGQDRMNQVHDGLVNTSLSLSYCLLVNVGLMMVINFFMSTFTCFKNYKLRLKMPSFFTRQKSYNYDPYRYNPYDNRKKEDPNQNNNQNPPDNYQNPPYNNQNQNQFQYHSQNPNPYYNQNPNPYQNQNPYDQRYGNHHVVGHNNNPDRYMGYGNNNNPLQNQQYYPHQLQQNPPPQYYEQQEFHNRPPQQNYVQNQEDPPVIEGENEKK